MRPERALADDHHGPVRVCEVIQPCGEHDLRQLPSVYVLQTRQVKVRPARDPRRSRHLREAVVAGARDAENCALNDSKDEGDLNAPVVGIHGLILARLISFRSCLYAMKWSDFLACGYACFCCDGVERGYGWDWR